VAAPALGKLLLGRGDRDEALAILEPLAGDFVAAGLVARATLEGALDDLPDETRTGLEGAFKAWDEGDAQTALEQLQVVFSAEQDPDRRDLIRKVMVAIFTELGPDHELAREHRRRLAAALN
jgi:thioredoxin-like negative regulator of GroEL